MREINSPISRLLWLALNTIKTAQKNHNITNELTLRRSLLKWLSGVSCHPDFKGIPREIMMLRMLVEKDQNIPIATTLNTLFLYSTTAGECPLFRFRAAIGKLQKAGWRSTVCPWPERVFNESITLACTGKRHLLQLNRTEECFLPTGEMNAPVSMQFIVPLRKTTKKHLEKAEIMFADEGFQVVRGFEHKFDIDRSEILFHTLFIGLPDLPEDVWGVRRNQTSVMPH